MAVALIVDDEVDLCRLMQMTLKRMDIDARIAYDLATASSLLAEQTFDFCLTDLRLPDGSGLDLVKQISQHHPNTPVAVITAHGNMDLAIEALKLGAFDFVNKPLELPRLRQLVENALKAAADANAQTTASAPPDLFAGKLIGQSAAILQLKNTIQKLARSQAPVFLWGESGTGKEVVARLIHELSPRSQASFVAVNCGAIPAELMESEFFGHKKGSFTGATTDKDGLFQQANGGTLFLDEVADLPLTMQVKLLRAIQEKKVRPIGGTQEVAVDIRLLSATHKNLAKLVEAGEFRQDLYYRIHVIEVRLPSLNQRTDDILLLATHFLAQIYTDWQLDTQPVLTDAAKRALLNHRYLGNVRELRNILERAVTLADSAVIDVTHLQLTPMEAAASQDTDDHPTNQHNTSKHDTSKHTIDKQDTDQQLTDSQLSTALPAMPTPTDSKPSPQATVSTRYQQTAFNPTIQLTPNTLAAGTVLPTSPAPTLQNAHDNPAPSQLGQQAHQTDEPTGVFASLSGVPLTDDGLPSEGLEAYLLQQERQLIIAALNQSDGNKTQAAKLLNMSFRSLRYRMKKLGLESDGDDD